MDCGGRFPPQAMDFDHREPSEKRFAISAGVVPVAPMKWAPGRKGRPKKQQRRVATWAELKAEVAKCDLVCSNCHRVRTTKRHRLRAIAQAARRFGKNDTARSTDG